MQRHGKDQVRSQYDAELEQRWFDNAGSSKTKQVDLYWKSNPIHLLNANWTVIANASWMDKETGSTYLNGTGGYLTDSYVDEEVIFEGKRIKRHDLPGSDLAIPVNINLDLITTALQNRLQAHNSLSFTRGYEALLNRGRDQQTGLRRYEIKEYGSTLRWDLSLEYQLLRRENSPYARLDIINVTDNGNIVRSEAGVQLFGVGRQYWMEIGYKF